MSETINNMKKKYRLRAGESSFEVVDGELTGRVFRHGRQYTEIPAGEQRRFAQVRRPAAKKTKTKGERK